MEDWLVSGKGLRGKYRLPEEPVTRRLTEPSVPAFAMKERTTATLYRNQCLRDSRGRAQSVFWCDQSQPLDLARRLPSLSYTSNTFGSGEKRNSFAHFNSPFYVASNLKPTALATINENGVNHSTEQLSAAHLQANCANTTPNNASTGSAEKRKFVWKYPLFSLFAYATLSDKVLMMIGFLSAFFAAWSVPTLNVIFGQIVNPLIHYESWYNHRNESPIARPDDRVAIMDSYCDDAISRPLANMSGEYENYKHDYLVCQVTFLCVTLYIVAFFYILFSYCSLICFEIAAFNQALTIKKKFFASVLRQDIEWYDVQESKKANDSSTTNDKRDDAQQDNMKASEFSTRTANDLLRIEQGMNENLSLLIYFVSSVLANMVYALYFGWKLALAIFCTIAPIVAISSAMLAKVQSTFVRKEMKAYAEAGSIALEIFTSIRTVLAFGGEQCALQQYDAKMTPATQSGIKRSVFNALGNAITWTAIYCGFALGLWYGVYLIINEPNSHYSMGTIIVVFWCSAAVGWNLGYTLPYMETVQFACYCAREIFATIEQQPKIQRSNCASDSLSPSIVASQLRKLPKNFCANIEFRDVSFAYPTRSTRTTLHSVNFDIKEGEIVAIVGPSGSGKSTLLQLVQRFYDPTSGEIRLDGIDIRLLDVGWLREQFGVVGQEPVLFDATIAENIILGAPNQRMRWVTPHEVEKASRAANAHEFITKLTHGYSTRVGAGGGQLSGGQKQRIAIARALIKNPKILLLDEATSALDLQSEAVVQVALDLASQGRTTIIVAHRLSTIINADKIICLDRDGFVAEIGTHSQLMAKQSAYYHLVLKEIEKHEEMKVRSGPITQRNSSESNYDTVPLDPTEPYSQIESQMRKTGNICFERDLALRTSVDHKASDKEAPNQGQSMLTVWKHKIVGNNQAMCRIVATIFRNNRAIAILGVTCAILFGLAVPMYAFLFGHFVNVFGHHRSPPVEQHLTSLSPPTTSTPISNSTSPSFPIGLVDGNANSSMAHTGSNISNPVLTINVNGTYKPYIMPRTATTKSTTTAPKQRFGGYLERLGLVADDIRGESYKYSAAFIALAFFAFITSFIQFTLFGLASQRLTAYLRRSAFNAMLHKPIAWFDSPANRAPILCATLSSDPAQIQGSTGPRIAMFCQALSTLLVSVIFGFYTCWNLSLVAFVFVPIIAFSANATATVIGQQASKEKDSNEEAAKIGQEALTSIRTIASLHKEDFFQFYYANTLDENIRQIKRKLHLKAISLACALGIPLVAYGSTFLYGGHLIADHQLTAGSLFQVIEAMIFGAIVFGQACFFSSDLSKARQAAVNLFQLIDSYEKPQKNDPKSDYQNRCSGRIEFRSVCFEYPTRPEETILQEISFTVEAGQKVALVGASGSGKSTLLQLLQRFYEPSRGQILLDDKPIDEVSVNWLRSQMALVSQEPRLFNTSIMQNIAYGRKWDTSAEGVPQLEAIKEAARRACVSDMIEQLPERYQTIVGPGGCLFSGGQKQRIAIARALVRDPSILLLDEATSALDSDSEQQIQTTLDLATQGRTCIIIAHRLCTIQNVDKILYLEHGRIVESGSHQELLARKGPYYTLYTKQNEIVQNQASH